MIAVVLLLGGLLVLGALAALASRQREITRLRRQVDTRDRLIDSLQTLAANAAGEPLSIQVLDEISQRRSNA